MRKNKPTLAVMLTSGSVGRFTYLGVFEQFFFTNNREIVHQKVLNF